MIESAASGTIDAYCCLSGLKGVDRSYTVLSKPCTTMLASCTAVMVCWEAAGEAAPPVGPSAAPSLLPHQPVSMGSACHDECPRLPGGTHGATS